MNMDRPAAARPAVVECDGASPTKEEMAREIRSLKEKVSQKNIAIRFYCGEIEKLTESNYRFRVSNGNLKDSYDELEEKYEFLNSMAVGMQKQSKAMEAERRLWRERMNVLTEDKYSEIPNGRWPLRPIH